MLENRFKFRLYDKAIDEMVYDVCVGFIKDYGKTDDWVCADTSCGQITYRGDRLKDIVLMQCARLKDKNGKLIYEGDIIVIPNQYPFYDYKNKEDMKQSLNSTEGEIKGESVLNYIGIVEWIYSQWQYVYHCVNPNKRGISEGVNRGLNDFGFDETENTCYEVIGNIYENLELLEDK